MNEMEMDDIELTLVLSTRNISETTASALETEVKFGLVGYPKDKYGWFIQVPDINRIQEIFDEHDEDFPSDLAFILGYAVGHNCAWLNIDRDNNDNDALPLYNW